MITRDVLFTHHKHYLVCKLGNKMKESIINHNIGKSLDWYHKIADGAMQKLPFDGFGLYQGKSIYWEAKYLPKPKSFNFHRLEDHQISNLLKIEILDQSRKNFVPLLLIAVNFGRADVRVFYYKNMQEIHERKLAKKNILKKEFESATNYVTIKKGLIDFDKIINEVQ